jgi:hypothetical protein
LVVCGNIVVYGNMTISSSRIAVLFVVSLVVTALVVGLVVLFIQFVSRVVVIVVPFGLVAAALIVGLMGLVALTQFIHSCGGFVTVGKIIVVIITPRRGLIVGVVVIIIIIIVFKIHDGGTVAPSEG